MIGRGMAAAAGVLVALAAGQPQQDPLSRAVWLAGCWEMRAGARITTEMWMPPAGGLMVGGSRTTVDGAAREFEHLRIRAEGGRLVYTAIPSGQRETAFSSVTVADTMLVFENPAHDFPQRIIYRRRGADSVVARAEGPGADNTTRGFNIPMRRASCTEVSPQPPPRPPLPPATLVPGDARLRLACTPMTDTLELVLATAGQAPRVTNTLVRTRARQQAAGGADGARCVWTQQYLGPQSTNVDTTVIDAATLAPLRFAVRVGSSGLYNQYAFTRDSLTATTQPRDSAARTTVSALPRPAFLATADQAPLEALPLGPDFTATFDLWRPPLSFSRISIRVERLDTLEVQGRPLAAWRVAWDDGNAQSTYWIARDAPRLIRTRTITSPNGQFWRRLRGDSIAGTP